MTISSENHAKDGETTGIEAAPEESFSRRSVIFRSLGSLPHRASVVSAALFAGIAARGTAPALAANWSCCNLARPDHWCATGGGDPGIPFWCNYGGYKRIWYCCQGAYLTGCGECQSGTGTCHDGPTWYCSYGWLTNLGC